MDNNSINLNDKWKNFFNWTITYPLIGFSLITMIFTFLIYNAVISSLGSSTSFSYDEIAGFAFLGGFVAILLTIFIPIAMIVYLVWFFIASDRLFQLLGVDRTIGNVLNAIGWFLLPGLSLLILPFYFWIKVREYWLVRGQPFSWRAIVK